MRLVHVVAPLAARQLVTAAVDDATVLFSCSDGNTAVAAASIASSFTRPFGVWLSVGADYGAQFAARDVATLSWLGPLRHVVVEAPASAEAHAAVVRALLTNDEVTIVNEVATITAAYNRPAPPEAITVWVLKGDQLVTPGTTLCASGHVVTALGRHDLYT